MAPQLLTDFHETGPKELRSLDTSQINGKIDFFRSMGLRMKRVHDIDELGIRHKEKKLSMPRRVKLRECSVVILGATCKICGRCFKCKTDVDLHAAWRHRRYVEPVETHQASNEQMCNEQPKCATQMENHKTDVDLHATWGHKGYVEPIETYKVNNEQLQRATEMENHKTDVDLHAAWGHKGRVEPTESYQVNNEQTCNEQLKCATEMENRSSVDKVHRDKPTKLRLILRIGKEVITQLTVKRKHLKVHATDTSTQTEIGAVDELNATEDNYGSHVEEEEVQEVLRIYKGRDIRDISEQDILVLDAIREMKKMEQQGFHLLEQKSPKQRSLYASRTSDRLGKENVMTNEINNNMEEPLWSLTRKFQQNGPAILIDLVNDTT